MQTLPFTYSFAYSLAVACLFECHKRHSVILIGGFSSHAAGCLFRDFICHASTGHSSHIIFCFGLACGHAVVILGDWSMYVAIILLNLGFQLVSVMDIVNAQRKIDVQTAKITLLVRIEQLSQEVHLVKRYIAYLVYLPPPPPPQNYLQGNGQWSQISSGYV